MLEIKEAISKALIKHARELFIEYIDCLGIDLEFQNFKEELEYLPADYGSPEGAILLAYYKSKLAGCVALRKFKNNICEMKRLFVRTEFRGRGIGKVLSERIIDKARRIGYKLMRLDTLSFMKEAINLYLSLGFKEIKSYRYNPFEDAKYFELKLRDF